MITWIYTAGPSTGQILSLWAIMANKCGYPNVDKLFLQGSLQTFPGTSHYREIAQSS
jgi:hypothetical protein